MYYFLADSLIGRFGEEGEGLVKAALRDLGVRRGRELSEKLKRAGRKITMKNALDDFDLPYSLFWKMKVETLNDKFVADVEYCPLSELWSEIGDEKLGAMYCQETYDSIFKALSAKAEIRIPQCMTMGASKCRFEFKI